MSSLKLFNYLPIGYTFQTRIKTVAERISWFLIFPSFLLITVLLNDSLIVPFIINFLIVLAAYEIGYLYNDVITTKFEDKPTLRHTAFQENKFQYCIIIRLIFCFILTVVLWTKYGINEGVWAFFSVIMINIIFYLHNTIRSRLNILTYFLLVSSRYLLPVFLLVESKYFIWILLIFPLCRTFEHACKKKYKLTFIKSLVGKPDVFRVYYLTFLTIISFFFDKTALYMTLYFLSIRLLALIVSQLYFFRRNKHDAY